MATRDGQVAQTGHGEGARDRQSEGDGRRPADPRRRLSGVGYNPFRQQRRRQSDYVLVAAAFVVVTLVLLWAIIPR